jgi:hypothetical protein
MVKNLHAVEDMSKDITNKTKFQPVPPASPGGAMGALDVKWKLT